jgi:ligand-binding sensor domain-containing protein
MCLGADGLVYVAGYDGGVMSYDGAAFEAVHAAEAPLLAGDGYSDIVCDGETGLLYVAEFDRDRVLAVRPGTGVIDAVYDVGDGPVRLRIVDP